MQRTRITEKDLRSPEYISLIESWVNDDAFPYAMVAYRGGYYDHDYLYDIEQMIDALVILFEEDDFDSLPKTLDAFTNALNHNQLFMSLHDIWDLTNATARTWLSYVRDHNTDEADVQRAIDVLELIEREPEKMGAYCACTPYVRFNIMHDSFGNFLIDFSIEAMEKAPIIENLEFVQQAIRDGEVDPVDLLNDIDLWDGYLDAYHAGVPVSDIFA